MNFKGVSLKKSFWRFVWPSVLAQWIFALYTMVDGMFVGQGCVGGGFISLQYCVALCEFSCFPCPFFLVQGTSTIVAIFLGTGKHREANQPANTQNLVSQA